MGRLGQMIQWLLVFFSVAAASLAHAEAQDRFVTSAGLAYSTLYVTDGFRVGDSSDVFQMTLKLDIPKSDFSVMYWNSLRVDRSKDRFDEHDFFILYSTAFNQESVYGFKFNAYYDYWDFPNNRKQRDPFGDEITNGKFHGSKLNAGLAFNNLLPILGSYLVPAYNVFYWIYWAQDRSDMFQGGARHELSLTFTRDLPEFSPSYQSPYVGLFTSVNYNDGAFNVKPGMSHTLVSAYTGFKALGLQNSLSANQQFSHQRTVNPRNDFWIAVSTIKEF